MYTNNIRRVCIDICEGIFCVYRSTVCNSYASPKIIRLRGYSIVLLGQSWFVMGYAMAAPNEESVSAVTAMRAYE